MLSIVVLRHAILILLICYHCAMTPRQYAFNMPFISYQQYITTIKVRYQRATGYKLDAHRNICYKYATCVMMSSLDAMNMLSNMLAIC